MHKTLLDGQISSLGPIVQHSRFRIAETTSSRHLTHVDSSSSRLSAVCIVNPYIPTIKHLKIKNVTCRKAVPAKGWKLRWAVHIILQELDKWQQMYREQSTSSLIFSKAAAASVSEENLTNPYPFDFPVARWHITFTVTHTHQSEDSS
jgi:hypothetical protein